jgi:hypothetical protein
LEFTAGTYVHLNDDDLPDGDVLADLLVGSADDETSCRAASSLPA